MSDGKDRLAEIEADFAQHGSIGCITSELRLIAAVKRLQADLDAAQQRVKELEHDVARYAEAYGETWMHPTHDDDGLEVER